MVDDFNWEILDIEIDLNLSAQRIVRVLERVGISRGYPAMIRLDNGPELISQTYRNELLDFFLFRTLNEAREITECSPPWKQARLGQMYGIGLGAKMDLTQAYNWTALAGQQDYAFSQAESSVLCMPKGVASNKTKY